MPRKLICAAGRVCGSFNPEVFLCRLDRERLVDVLAMESEEEVCVICGSGFSAEPNLIVFCDRCNVPTHQHCAGIDHIPEGEYLCLTHDTEFLLHSSADSLIQ